MLEKHRSEREGFVDVTFVLCSDGHETPVHLASELNGWDPSSVPLTPVSEDHLAVTVSLPAGSRFQFRYCDARGRWFNDHVADDYCENEWGGMNGVVET